MTEVRQDNGKQWSSFSIAAIFFVLIALAFLARGVLRNRRITQLRSNLMNSINRTFSPSRR